MFMVSDFYCEVLLQTWKTASGTQQMFKMTFGEQAMGRRQTFEWFAKLRMGLTSVESAEHSGHPSTARTDESVARVNELVNYSKKTWVSLSMT
jgi:hypothetical protein